MKKRMQVTLGPKTGKIVTALRRHYMKQTSSDWSDVDILESALGHGLRFMREKTGIKTDLTSHCRE